MASEMYKQGNVKSRESTTHYKQRSIVQSLLQREISITSHSQLLTSPERAKSTKLYLMVALHIEQSIP